MRKIKFLTVSLILSIVFASCSSDENLSLENQNAQLLKSYQVKKDIDGKFYLDFDVNADTKVDKIFNKTTNTNQLFLFPSDKKTNRNLTENFELTNSNLKIEFLDTESDKTPPSITITDDNIAFAKGNTEELTSYSVAGNEDGTFQLDFTVTSNVNVDFVYNDTLEAYEVHLQEGKNNGTSFSRNFEKEEGKPLRIDFINHFSVAARSENLEKPRKPKIIIDNGEGN